MKKLGFRYMSHDELISYFKESSDPIPSGVLEMLLLDDFNICERFLSAIDSKNKNPMVFISNMADALKSVSDFCNKMFSHLDYAYFYYVKNVNSVDISEVAG